MNRLFSTQTSHTHDASQSVTTAVPLTMPTNQSGAALMPGQIGSTNLITPSVGLTHRGVTIPNPNVLMTPVVAPGLSAAAPARMSPVVGVSPVKPISPVQPCTPGTPGLVAPVSPAAIGMVASPQLPTGKLES